MARHIKSVPKRPNEAVPDAKIPKELEDVVMRSLAKSPEDRQANADVFAGELLAALEAQGALTSGVSCSGHERGGHPRPRLAAAAAGHSFRPRPRARRTPSPIVAILGVCRARRVARRRRRVLRADEAPPHRSRRAGAARLPSLMVSASPAPPPPHDQSSAAEPPPPDDRIGPDVRVIACPRNAAATRTRSTSAPGSAAAPHPSATSNYAVFEQRPANRQGAPNRGRHIGAKLPASSPAFGVSVRKP